MHVLLVEDDRQLRQSIARGLKEAAYEVDQASTGTQALALATSHDYDAIVLDILLPGKSGIAVCEAVRERGDHVPILMLTALDGVEQRIAGLDAGADDYLTKPFDFGELLARLRALTRRHGEGAPQLTIGDLVIDVPRQLVRRGERAIDLTAREFAFLLYMARHAGRVVSRAELMTNVWGESHNTFSNILDVYAGRLRRKIDEDEPVALFTTRRGSGFVLEAPPAAKLPARAGRKGAARRKE
ncbi:MAG: response regulator transcription factor [Gemmatimonadetes bacterium]|nr:response regulator transcription factor [Gemmatimonadota bacterium]